MPITFSLPAVLLLPSAPATLVPRPANAEQHKATPSIYYNNGHHQGNKRPTHCWRTSIQKACKLPFRGCLMRVKCWKTRLFTISSARCAS